MSNLLDDLVRDQKRGLPCGIPSICSAHPWVLKVALKGSSPILIESTCNQVNQFGGYTGMTPADFLCSVNKIAALNDFPKEKLLLGGDHLGPSPWQLEPAASAMSKAGGLVRFYVQAGFIKIHLDASMSLGGDPLGPLDPGVSARRTVELARIAEESIPDISAAPRYVIGTEVPPPGGAGDHSHRINITSVEAAQSTFEFMHAAFIEAGLFSAWERVIAMVVQPGVEFGDDFVLDYNPQAAHGLAGFSEKLPFVYEAHSTDYQRRDSLRDMVRDHFAILKVGPALTFAYREALFALAMMETELFAVDQRSKLVATLERVMLQNPAHWLKHYQGTLSEQAFARKYSLSDRVRYYWTDPLVQAAVEKMLANFGSGPIPMSLLSQYAPLAFDLVRKGEINNNVGSVINASVQTVLADYYFASNLD
jgi:D-tagatose-1,6-bisphosphate aldolase subunit GatZ/KbaZ